MEKDTTIIVPIFNEEESLPQLFQRLDLFLQKVVYTTNILLVNDGSVDSSLHLIKHKCDQSPSYTYISFDKNYGLSSGIKAGIDHCTTPLLGYIDADLQTDPMDFVQYFKYFPEYDMVNGIRAKRKDTVVKRISSKLANRYRRIMIADGIQDSCCPLKIMKTEFAKKIPFFSGLHRFIPALIQLQGGKVYQIPVSHYPRNAGKSKYHLSNRLVGPFFDTLAFRWMKSRQIDYLINEQQ